MTEVRTVTNLAATVTTVTSSDAPAIGVLALQGGFHEHMVMLSKLGAKVTEVRQVQDLDATLDGLVVPGGESTTMGHLAERLGLLEPLRAFVKSGRPVMGTCAGLIFLANEVLGQKEGGQELVGGLDVSVQRNFFGSQVASPPVPPATSHHLELSGACAAARRAGRFFRDDAERDVRPGARDPRGLHPRACDHAQGRQGRGALAARRQERRPRLGHCAAAGGRPAGQPARDRVPPRRAEPSPAAVAPPP